MEAPAEASLAVWPNPTRGSTTLGLTVSEASTVRVAVYDVLGREVVRLADGLLEAGRHEFAFDAVGLPSDVYLVRVAGSDADAAQRLTVVR